MAKNRRRKVRSNPRHGRATPRRMASAGNPKMRAMLYHHQKLRKEEVAAFDPHLLSYLVDSDGNFITDSDGNLIYVNEV